MKTRHWPYIVVGVVFAGVMGWISYTDALFVTRLAGNDGGIAYAYPTLPDGLLFFSLLALTEAARAGAARPRWATAGLILGAAMTLAANAGAGLGHSILDAVIDGLVPVCFFICVEIVLWHIRRGRAGASPTPARPPEARTVPSSNFEAAIARMREATDHGFTYSDNRAKDDFGLTRAQTVAARKKAAEDAPAGATSNQDSRAPAGALNGRAHG